MKVYCCEASVSLSLRLQNLIFGFGQKKCKFSTFSYFSTFFDISHFFKNFKLCAKFVTILQILIEANKQGKSY
jgi:hypothetical protein